MYRTLRPLLFRVDPERAHQITLTLLRWAGRSRLFLSFLRALFEVNDPRLAVEAFGLSFKNPVGLAAGYDKNGMAVRGLGALGFGHIEVGTVTPRPQAGHPQPRVHRLPGAQAIINSMGFPNAGVEAVLKSSEAWRGIDHPARIGLNLGKGKDTPLERAADDYVSLLERVHRHCDYVAINISSPNTLGLRQLQARAAMEALLKDVIARRDRLTPRVPLLVKLAPDLSAAELDEALCTMTGSGVDGIIATNTTLRRDGLPEAARSLPGGLSGRPLTARATEVIRYLARHTSLPIIGVGGIVSPEDALEKLDAGATLVQVYTGLIYAGPGLVKQINQRLAERR